MIDIELDGKYLTLPIELEAYNGGTPVPVQDIVHVNTTAYWNSKRTFVGIANHLYVYSDYDQYNGHYIPAIKVSDGSAYLIDQPFISLNTSELKEHTSNYVIHITQAEREFWNNKVRCDETEVVNGKLIFTTL